MFSIWVFPKIGVHTPKWMVKIMVPIPIKHGMIWGEKSTPLFLGSTPIFFLWHKDVGYVQKTSHLGILSIQPEAGIHSEGVKKAWPWNEAMNRIDSTLAFLEPKTRRFFFGKGVAAERRREEMDIMISENFLAGWWLVASVSHSKVVYFMSS